MTIPVENLGRQPTPEELGVVLGQVKSAVARVRLAYIDENGPKSSWDRLEAFQAGVQMGIDSTPAKVELPQLDTPMAEVLEFRIGQEKEKRQPTITKLEAVLREVKSHIDRAMGGYVDENMLAPVGRKQLLERDRAAILEAFRAAIELGMNGTVANLEIPRSATMTFRIEPASSIRGPVATILPSGTGPSVADNRGHPFS